MVGIVRILICVKGRDWLPVLGGQAQRVCTAQCIECAKYFEMPENTRFSVYLILQTYYETVKILMLAAAMQPYGTDTV